MATNLHFSNIAWRSEVGLQREGNEDSGFVSPNILAVADGMGGYIGGEIASRTVITKLAELNPILSNPELDHESREDLLRSSITTMDSAIAEIGAQRPELVGMGTTLTSISLFNNYVLLLHVGDSRAYRIRGKKIEQISHDHTVVQELVDQGRLTLDEIADHPQRSFLTQAIMGKENLILLELLKDCSDVRCFHAVHDQQFPYHRQQVLLRQTHLLRPCLAQRSLCLAR